MQAAWLNLSIALLPFPSVRWNYCSAQALQGWGPGKSLYQDEDFLSLQVLTSVLVTKKATGVGDFMRRKQYWDLKQTETTGFCVLLTAAEQRVISNSFGLWIGILVLWGVRVIISHYCLMLLPSITFPCLLLVSFCFFPFPFNSLFLFHCSCFYFLPSVISQNFFKARLTVKSQPSFTNCDSSSVLIF